VPDLERDGECESESRAVLLTIRDDGVGFEPDAVSRKRLGLGIMHERAQAIGAQLAIDSQPGNGTEVTVRWTQEE
jgi:signal transduction histidine kinase